MKLTSTSCFLVHQRVKVMVSKKDHFPETIKNAVQMKHDNVSFSAAFLIRAILETLKVWPVLSLRVILWKLNLRILLFIEM